MLNIIFGDCPDAIYNTSVYFNNTYEDEWLTDEFARKVIKAIDKSEVVNSRAVSSPVLGIIPTEKIAGGTKTLLLIKNKPDMIFNASTCGDNCARYILEIAESTDITINLRHVMDFKRKKFKAHILNNDVYVDNYRDYLLNAVKFV
ncbi:DUF4869 domain-containing protein [Ruminococcus sp. HUN007]|jgi:hypothetical protein|uniref:DUF4869 domain-containing protein n=1 Tax=Ruminococcus sp. HUN007 TaxID=1514668 RepID=UPI0005D1C81B|nr:DUF4869 domain-containing protein [Ruminococcus sp. HUN007]